MQVSLPLSTHDRDGRRGRAPKTTCSQTVLGGSAVIKAHMSGGSTLMLVDPKNNRRLREVDLRECICTN
jgi:hypothetical protein